MDHDHFGHTALSIQSVYEAIRVEILGKRVPQPIPKDMIPTMVDTPDASTVKTGPPESPAHASLILSDGEDASRVQRWLSSKPFLKLLIFACWLYSNNVALHESSGTIVTYVFCNAESRLRSAMEMNISIENMLDSLVDTIVVIYELHVLLASTTPHPAMINLVVSETSPICVRIQAGRTRSLNWTGLSSLINAMSFPLSAALYDGWRTMTFEAKMTKVKIKFIRFEFYFWTSIRRNLTVTARSTENTSSSPNQTYMKRVTALNQFVFW